MPEFAFRARTRRGEPVRGRLEAASLDDARVQLAQRDLIVTDLRRVWRPPWRGAGTGRLLAPPVRARDLAILCRQLATMIAAGVPILQAVETSAAQSGHAVLRAELRRVAARLHGGAGLSAAFDGRPDVFPRVLVEMLHAGETAGALDEVLRRLAMHFEREAAMAEKIRTATTYPKIVLLVAVVVVAVMVTVVLPQFVTLFTSSGVQLPATTRFLLALSRWVRQGYAIWGPGLVALGLLGLWAGRQPAARMVWARLALRVPVFGPLALKRAIARFARTLATLLRGGVPVLQALDVAVGVTGNAALEAELLTVREFVRAGGTLAEALGRVRSVPALVPAMVAVGEDSGRVDESF
ncbi:MAG: type II secretion system F family protein, partial [Clostridia bacterium]|nr:type II secretion system F family protein [Clostridia bacterium]